MADRKGLISDEQRRATTEQYIRENDRCARGTATLKYDFSLATWLAVADWNERLAGTGETPEQAQDSLRYECNKHDLWPKGD